MIMDLAPIIESLLLVSGSPLGMDRLRAILPEAGSRDILKALEEIRRAHEERKGGFILVEVAGGWQFRTRPEYKQWVQRFVEPPPVRLSRAALETLAIVAYKQPVIRNDIERIRGVDSGGVLRMLMERKLVRVLGRKDIPGRPLIYGTTKRFLEVFELKDLKELPTPGEIEELMAKNETAGLDDGFPGAEDEGGAEEAETDAGADESAADAREASPVPAPDAEPPDFPEPDSEDPVDDPAGDDSENPDSSDSHPDEGHPDPDEDPEEPV